MSTGYSPRRLSEIRKKMREDIRAAWGSDVNLDSSGSLLGRLVDIISSRISETEESVGELFRAFDANEARGMFQDNLFEGLCGIPRKKDTRSTVLLTLGGVSGSEIPRSAIVKDVSGNLWLTSEKAVIGAAGTVDVLAASAEYGPIKADIGEVITIVTPYDGWESVTNTLPCEIGSLEEDASEYRLRKSREMAGTGSCYAAATRKHVERISYAPGKNMLCRVVENREAHEMVVDGYTILPHSYMVIIHPVDLPVRIHKEIAKVIWQNGPPGIRTMGDIGYLATDAAGEQQKVRFQGALVEYYDVQVSQYPFSYDNETAINEALDGYFETLMIGKEPSASRAQCSIIKRVPWLDDVKVTFTGGPVGPRTMPLLGEVTISQ